MDKTTRSTPSTPVVRVRSNLPTTLRATTSLPTRPMVRRSSTRATRALLTLRSTPSTPVVGVRPGYPATIETSSTLPIRPTARTSSICTMARTTVSSTRSTCAQGTGYNSPATTGTTSILPSLPTARRSSTRAPRALLTLRSTPSTPVVGGVRFNSPTTTPTSSTLPSLPTARGSPTRASTETTTSQRSTRSAPVEGVGLKSRRAQILPTRPTARRSSTRCTKDPLPESTRSTSAEGVRFESPPAWSSRSLLPGGVVRSAARIPRPPGQGEGRGSLAASFFAKPQAIHEPIDLLALGLHPGCAVLAGQLLYVLVVDLPAHLELDQPLLGQALVFCGYAVEILLRLSWQSMAQGASHLARGVLPDSCPLHLHELIEGIVLWLAAHVRSSAKCIYILCYSPECAEG